MTPISEGGSRDPEVGIGSVTPSGGTAAQWCCAPLGLGEVAMADGGSCSFSLDRAVHRMGTTMIGAGKTGERVERRFQSHFLSAWEQPGSSSLYTLGPLLLVRFRLCIAWPAMLSSSAWPRAQLPLQHSILPSA